MSNLNFMEQMSKEFSINSHFEPIDVVSLHTIWWPQLHRKYHRPHVSTIYFMRSEKWCLPLTAKTGRRGWIFPGRYIFSAKCAWYLWVGKLNHFWWWTSGEVICLCRQAGRANKQSTYLYVYKFMWVTLVVKVCLVFLRQKVDKIVFRFFVADDLNVLKYNEVT